MVNYMGYTCLLGGLYTVITIIGLKIKLFLIPPKDA